MIRRKKYFVSLVVVSSMTAGFIVFLAAAPTRMQIRSVESFILDAEVMEKNGNQLFVLGSGFTPSTTVRFFAFPALRTTVLSSKQLIASVSLETLPAGWHDLAVVNADGSSAVLRRAFGVRTEQGEVPDQLYTIKKLSGAAALAATGNLAGRNSSATIIPEQPLKQQTFWRRIQTRFTSLFTRNERGTAHSPFPPLPYENTAANGSKRLLLKFTEEASQILDRSLDPTTLRAPLPITGLAPLNTIHEQFALETVQPLFPTLKRRQLTSGQTMDDIVHTLTNRFPKRALRAQLSTVPNLGAWYAVTLKDEKHLRLAQAAFRRDPSVLVAESDGVRTASRLNIEQSDGVGEETAPNDPYFSSRETWNQQYDDQWDLKRIKVPAAWSISKGSGDVIVAVTDTGVDYNHLDLQGNLWQNTDEVPSNSLDDDGNGYVDDYRGYDFSTCETFDWTSRCIRFKQPDSDPLDGNGHGSHVAGTIAAVTQNQEGVAGISWYSKIMPVQGLNTQGSGFTSDLANTIYYATENGADILNMSWGSWGYSSVLDEAVTFANTQGVLLVAAAGNSSSDTASYSPAGLPNVLTVGAWGPDERIASFSNYGNALDAVAPGIDVLSLRANGTDMYGDGTHIVGERYYRSDGTSMAAPHAVGVAALLLAFDNAMTPDLVTALIQGAADDVLDAGKDVTTGYGILDAYESLALTQTGKTQLLPELLVAETSTVSPVGNTEITINAAIRNASPFAATNVSYRVYAGVPEDNVVLDEGIIPQLDAESAFSLQATYTAATLPTVVTLRLDPDGLIAEYVEKNNTAVLPLQAAVHDGWPQSVGAMVAKALTVDDLDGDGQREVIAGSDTPDSKLYVWRQNGTLVPGWPKTLAGDWFSSSPATADLDGDGIKEIIASGANHNVYAWRLNGSSFPGWPKSVDAPGCITVADLDGDGGPEILTGTGYSRIYAWQPDGSDVPGWPYLTNQALPSCPVVVDLDNQPGMEVVASGIFRMEVVRADGTKMPGWPRTTGLCGIGTPAVGDIDGDGFAEIVFGCDSYYTSAWNHDGTSLPGWPIRAEGPTKSSPALLDVDRDGKLDVVMGVDKVYAWRYDATLVPGWPRSVGGETVQGSPAVGDLDGDNEPDIVTVGADGYLYAWHTDGVAVAGWPRGYIGATGRGSTLYFTPLIADLDGDTTAEVIVGSMLNQIFVWSQSQIGGKPASWPTLHQGYDRIGVSRE